ncbi:hypothetical protein IAT38_000242 [Cryptococcus sp. DSM 104549]
MSLSSRLIDLYEESKSSIPPSLLSQTSYNRNTRPSIASRSAPRQKPSLANRVNASPVRTPVRMNPNDSSWMSGHGDQSFHSFGGQSFATSTQRGYASQWSEERIHQIQARLARKLGPEYVTQRPGPGGSTKLSYIEGWKVINLANEVFGYNGWSSSIVSLTTDFLEQNKEGRVSVNVTAIIRITLLDGTFHEDVGCGQGENIKGKGAALDKAQKEAVTDGTKRALRTFGNVLGNCLYDKNYTKEVVKMKVPAAKFNTNELERRPEFLPAGANPSAGLSVPSAAPPPQPMPRNIPFNGPNTSVGPGTSMLPPRNLNAAPPPPGTPLRSVSEPEVDEFSMLDENFDAEFMDFDSDSLMAQLDEQSLQAIDGPLPGASAAKPPAVPAQPDRPVYQHRQRPDMPRSSSGGQPLQPAQPAPPSLNDPPTAQNHHHHAQAKAHPPQPVRPQAAVSGGPSTSTPPEAGEAPRPSSGNTVGSATTSGPSNATSMNGALPKPRPAGSFGFPGGAPRNAAASSARAQAIASALNAGKQARPESPRIPTGGIDAVAQRASNKLLAEGARLGLDENRTEEGMDMSFGGFTSARGMKRAGDGDGSRDRRSASPSKGPGINPPPPPQFERSGPRIALGELPLKEDEWGAKRTRMS